MTATTTNPEHDTSHPTYPAAEFLRDQGCAVYFTGEYWLVKAATRANPEFAPEEMADTHEAFLALALRAGWRSQASEAARAYDYAETAARIAIARRHNREAEQLIQELHDKINARRERIERLEAEAADAAMSDPIKDDGWAGG